MAKLLKVVLLILVFLLCALQSYAIEPFIESPLNPLVVTQNFENWEASGFMQASILFENLEYKSWFTSIGDGLKISLGESNDGLHWGAEKLYLFSNNNSHDPSILKDGTNYHLFFASTPNDQKTRIMKSILENDYSIENSNLRTILSPELNWEINGVSSPTIFSENDNYYLFYTGLNTQWAMGLAVSNNSENFSKCDTNPILIGDTVPKSLIKLSNTYYLFFHSPNGIEYIETDKLGCDSVWKNRTVVMNKGFFPYALQKDSEILLYYGTNIGGVWQLNLATSPIKENKPPIIIIPGMFASWNKEAVLHNATVSQSDWVLNPIVSEYSGIEQTLQNIGYLKNQDHFVFTYDWRQNLETTADELNNFLASQNFSSKPHLVGHSLGGVVGRIYLQKYGMNNIDQLVSIGAPQKGAIQSYTAVEGGEQATDDPLRWLAQELVLQLNRQGFETDRQVLNRTMPVLQNLFPIENFLQKNGRPISISSMKVKNNLQDSFLTGFDLLSDNVYDIIGEGIDTISGYEVGPRTIYDKLLDNYPDGRPINNLTASGDGVVTTTSATVSNRLTHTTLNHVELIYSLDGIKQILNTLNIPYEEGMVVQSHKTNVSPSLLFLMLSPAQLRVANNGTVFEEKQGTIFIDNAQNGTYELSAIGKEMGKYTILIGQIGKNNTLWTQLKGEIKTGSQTDTYVLNVNLDSPENPLSEVENQFDELIAFLSNLDTTSDRQNLSKAISNLKLAKTQWKNGKKAKVKSLLLLTHQQLFAEYRISKETINRGLLDATDKLELLYKETLKNYNVGLSHRIINTELALFNKIIPLIRKYLLLQKTYNKPVQNNTMILLEVINKKEEAAKALKQKDLVYSQILLKSMEALILNIKI